MILVKIWLLAVYGYALLMFANEHRQTMPLFWKVHLYPLVAVVYVADLAFNYTFGFMFLQWPAETLFSGTVQHHVDHSEGWRKRLGGFWKGVLNWPDPTHIR